MSRSQLASDVAPYCEVLVRGTRLSLVLEVSGRPGAVWLRDASSLRVAGKDELVVRLPRNVASISSVHYNGNVLAVELA